jgi:hypothetical protein
VVVGTTGQQVRVVVVETHVLRQGLRGKLRGIRGYIGDLSRVGFIRGFWNREEIGRNYLFWEKRFQSRYLLNSIFMSI